MQIELPVSPEILSAVASFDRFEGSWSANQPIAADRLRRIEQAALIQSTGASCRLSGIRVSDAEVAGLLRDGAVPAEEMLDVTGYAAALADDAGIDLLDGERIRRLHGAMLGSAGPSPWRSTPLHREAFDGSGRATGRVLATLPPRFVARKTEELATWLELELREHKQHPVLIIGAYALFLFSIAPFARGNGRLTRMLTHRLLCRVGYETIRYASLDAEIEAQRDAYFATICQCQTGMWTAEAKLEPWLLWFCEALGRQRERVERKIALERDVLDYPPLQRAILETVREHGSVDASLLRRATGANRNTLKDNLRKLVQRGVLERTGQRRGTRYHMSSGETR